MGSAVYLPEVGTKVKVVDEINGHQFKIGEWVEVYKVKPEYILCQNATGKQFGLTNQEYESI